MLFNPIFINPQKFLTTADNGNLKQNKLSYLFSDIIKNSMGSAAGSEENVSVSSGAAEVKSMPAVVESPVFGNKTLSTEENNLLTELMAALTNVNSNKQEPQDQIGVNVNPEKVSEESLVEEGSAASVLSGLLQIIKKYNLDTDSENIEMPEGLLSKELSGNSSFANQLINLIGDGEELNLKINTGSKIVTVSISKKLLSGIDEVLPDQIKLNNKVKIDSLTSTNEKKSANEILTAETKKVAADTGGLLTKDIKVNPKETEGSVTATSEGEKTVDEKSAQPQKEIVSTPSNINKKVFKILFSAGENKTAAQTGLVKDSVPKKLLNIEKPKATFQIKAKAPVAAENFEIKKDNPTKNFNGTKLIQSIRNINNQMLKTEIVPGEIKFNHNSVEEIKNQKFEFYNLSGAVRNLKGLNKSNAQITNTKAVKNVVKPSSKLDNNKIDVKEISTSGKELLSAIKSQPKDVQIKELKNFLTENKNENLSIKIVPSETKPVTEQEIKNSIPVEKQPQVVKTVEEDIPKKKIIPVEKNNPEKNIKPILENKPEKKTNVEAELPKFKEALKVRGGNKKIQELIASADTKKDSKVVVEILRETTEKNSIQAEQKTTQITTEINNSKPHNSSAAEIVNSKTINSIDQKNNESLKVNSQEHQVKTKSGDSEMQSGNDESYAKKENNRPVVNQNSETAATQKNNFERTLENISAVTQPDSNISTSEKPAEFTPEISTNVKQIKPEEIYKELYKAVEAKEKQSITLQLIPKKLGRVKIVVDIVDQMVQTKIEVENESAKQLLQNNADQLKQSLTQSGIQLNSYSVSLSNSNNKSYKNSVMKKKIERSEELETNETEDNPISGKKMGYNTYEYLI